MHQRQRILVADSSKYFDSSIWWLLLPEQEFKIVGLACKPEEAIEMATALLPDIILVDLSHSQMGGLQTIKALHTRHSNTAIVTFMSLSSQDYTRAALDAGAVACLTKSEMADALLQTLRELVPLVLPAFTHTFN